ncbi:zonular occludens toxin domain-containing protein [Citrobacter sp. MGH105]|uniref:zonular occludens toxin domain-containing protein n=1 Tax=Citrobacter sp. MGH105 TaxID=1686380 RepID=UPI00065968AA|nr:zonular occludens toxin domain-containing protein [Citrobacter sp. MGH105]
MAINLYVGLQGAGKSYESVKSVILPALAQGQRVVSNIEGLDKEKVYNYVKKIFKVEESAIGELVYVEDDFIKRDDFFPTEAGDSEYVKYGDLVVIDEAWRFFDSERTLLPNHKQFFGMLRHYGCQMAVINQTNGLCKSLLGRIQTTYKMHRAFSVGFKTRYSIISFSGSEMRKQDIYKTQAFLKYNPEIFSLYKSEKQKASTKLDKRQNIWSVFGLLLLTIGVLAVSATFLFNRFYGVSPQRDGNVTTSTTQQRPSTATTNFIEPTQKATAYRYVGFYSKGDQRFALLRDENQLLVIIPYSRCTNEGRRTSCEHENEKVTFYGGIK